MDKKSNGVSLNLILLNDNAILEKAEFLFNLCGILCPISTLIGLGIGAYNKKIAEDNLNLLVNTMNDLIKSSFILNQQMKDLNKEMSEQKKEYEKAIKSNATIALSKKIENSLIKIDAFEKDKEEALRNFSLSLQQILDETIKEKSKGKIEQYAEYIIQTIADEIIFCEDSKFNDILKIIASLNEYDYDTIIYMNKKNGWGQFKLCYDGEFDRKEDSHSLEKLISMGLVAQHTRIYSDELKHPNDYINTLKCYELTSYFESIVKYMPLEVSKK